VESVYRRNPIVVAKRFLRHRFPATDDLRGETGRTALRRFRQWQWPRLVSSDCVERAELNHDVRVHRATFRWPSHITFQHLFSVRDKSTTVMEVTDSTFGCLEEATTLEGWRLLFEDGFKAWIERKESKKD
jgi:hypothetical protein